MSISPQGMLTLIGKGRCTVIFADHAQEAAENTAPMFAFALCYGGSHRQGFPWITSPKSVEAFVEPEEPICQVLPKVGKHVNPQSLPILPRYGPLNPTPTNGRKENPTLMTSPGIGPAWAPWNNHVCPAI